MEQREFFLLLLFESCSVTMYIVLYSPGAHPVSVARAFRWLFLSRRTCQCWGVYL